MRSLICPISPLRVKHSVVRITGFMMASLIALFVFTGNLLFLGLCVVDYAIRAFTPLAYSPFSLLADWLAGALGLSDEHIDKAPKIFAARVGFLFALTALLLTSVQPEIGLAVALTLMSFALLESLFALCVGCLVYTYIVFPLLGDP
jgi:hypothetical protein